MRDKGTVVETYEGMARVEVRCLSACHDCSAHSLCIGHHHSRGLISARNPLRAAAGDEVEIFVPESSYNRALILLFGGLLAAILLGLAGGYLLGSTVKIPAETASVLGLFLGLSGGVAGLVPVFKKWNRNKLFPVITENYGKGA
ncbi:MAG: SoxR reducing system RseC family protein [Acidobacteria bacterium]|nr:SoxR reducing system RseC family protein [Acidobacteriota bacterium]MCG2814672.1 SoxR reducing system RseC family protein [Candidatus Aminicenantes bacterium]MBU1338835.1 SoxR reducing system RseC family protein [Acidobacteriota bacterium]MBU1474165.1 SoxR reducing system RseC family protein [Acidobacteriota bacterium]MBU2439069.1 SoxR reducing system RseC family protein [Acidobacteriota bacterium]